MLGINLFFLFLGIITGIFIMACIAASGRKSFEEEIICYYEEKMKND